MITKTEIIAEIATQLKQYDEAGLVDYISVDLWIRNALREFGGNVMEATETTIEVIDGRARLPEDYYSLVLAMKCEPYGYYANNKTKKHLQSAYFYKERLEQQAFWDNQLGEVPCIDGEDCKFVIEELFFHDKTNNKRSAYFYYDNLQVLRLKQGFKKVKCEKGCPNLYTYDSPYEISIQGNFIQTSDNFREGHIYLRYRGLPKNEEGELVIPEIQRNKLQEYVRYTCIRRTLENLLLNSDDPNIGQKYQLFRQLENESYSEAKKDAINEGMLGWSDAIRRNNRRFTRRFELMYAEL